jgi:uncharacterized protein (DUF433 family)
MLKGKEVRPMSATAKQTPTRQPVTESHIWLDERGRAWIDDTNTKVIEVAAELVAYGWSADEMHEQHPDLSLAQLHAALAYYYDHKAEIDTELDRQDREFDELRAQSLNSPIRQKLRALGKIP